MNVGVAIGNLGFAMKKPMEPAAHADLCCEVAVKVERYGFHSVWVGDHLTLPQRAEHAVSVRRRRVLES